ncbi:MULTISPECIES: pyridoxal-dependent decarboxylase, exosortase A system-associated [unclassified Sphingopyxis]|jgi:diaminopimelate decarboxylase|uniref:pyridoxal-dependent decarboxylase, exosortase A system-associated n=1 Tax=unclassified Sphingopyxis TaxID=2614943 RepID=UPI0028605E56|nr:MULTISPECIES: pyridoxal-dependent decarboxylase, exosortase A system-associated [unclassified Sphingopyxis]MDR6832374.1 diaminopimelate decarboxylase [Sphingopyxis sp. BE122]MDR7228117.1 diaminopimelate decarboxylase [Sphingopyxis sp. BE259]
MKPHGPIPPGYAADDDGMLLIGGDRADTLADMAGDTPLFVYDSAMLAARVAAWRAAMPAEVQLHFAMKANPYAPLLAFMARLVDGFDVASGGELKAALASGMAAGDISFAGPGKRDRELEATITAGATLNLESAGEADRALSIASRLGLTPSLAVRVNPDFDLKGSGMKMGGGAKPFGVDAAEVPALVRRLIAAGADWQGFHIFAGSQALDAGAIAHAQAQTVALAARLADDIGATPPLVNLGGGMGVPYFPGDTAVDAAAVGAALGETLAGRDAALADSRFAMELGRWLVAEAGVYLTRVVDRKTSHGETFLVTDGGLHHQLAASGNFGTVIRRNYPIAVAHAFGDAPTETVSVVGCLCTPLDRLGDQVALPRADVGDLIAIFQAGAYGASASPAAFLGQGPAREMLV